MGLPVSDDSDELLVAQAKSGSHTAFEVLLGRYGVRLVAFLQQSCRLPPDSVEDVAHEVWLKVWQALPAWESGHFRGWLFTIARRTAADHAEKAFRRATAPLTAASHVADSAAPVGRDAEVVDEVKRLVGCREKLPPELRAAFDGWVCGRSDDEQATEAGVGVVAIRTRRARARAMLRACMGMGSE